VQQYVLFKSHQQFFAIDVMNADRIIESPDLIRFPEVPEFILGLYEYQDQIVPVTDIRKKLFGDFSIQQPENKIILSHWQDQKQGFYVEEVIGVSYMEETHYEEALDHELLKSGYIERFLKTSEGDVVLLLGLKQLFNNQQTQEVFSHIEELEELSNDHTK